MAVGDAVVGMASVAVGAVFDIRPPAGAEWSIHNIKYDGAVELYDARADGIGPLQWGSDATLGARLNGAFEMTNDQWVQVKNNDSVAIFVSYDGRQTK